MVESKDRYRKIKLRKSRLWHMSKPFLLSANLLSDIKIRRKLPIYKTENNI